MRQFRDGHGNKVALEFGVRSRSGTAGERVQDWAPELRGIVGSWIKIPVAAVAVVAALKFDFAGIRFSIHAEQSQPAERPASQSIRGAHGKLDIHRVDWNYRRLILEIRDDALPVKDRRLHIV